MEQTQKKKTLKPYSLEFSECAVRPVMEHRDDYQSEAAALTAIAVPGDACGMALAEGLAGEPFVALAEVALPGTLRVLYPRQMVLAGVQGDRLNAAVDGAGRIVGVFCG